MVTKNVYYLRKIAWVTLTDRGIKNMNLGWGDADFIVYKGAYSYLEFIVRDVDRKPVKLVGMTVKCFLIHDNTNELYLERELEIVNPVEGRCKLTLTPGDSIDWAAGHIRYSLQIFDSDLGTSVYLYNDLNQEALGYIELRDRAFPAPPQIKEAKTFTPVSTGLNQPTVWYSGSFKGPGQELYTSSLMTFAVYLENYSGMFFVETTLDPQPDGDNTKWVKIDLLPGQSEITYTNKSGVDPYNISGQYQWIRFGYYQNSGDEGKISKILLN